MCSPPGTSHGLILFSIQPSCHGGNPKPLPHDTKLRRGKSEKNLYFRDQGFSEPGASPQNYFEAVGAPEPEQSSKQDMAGLGMLSSSLGSGVHPQIPPARTATSKGSTKAPSGEGRGSGQQQAPGEARGLSGCSFGSEG